ncbi:hypothetical protein KA977_15360, partial [Candidatus Dependentiae bacterium]|nr:hypothetical protein [Candidatus Dependentiae bacterium]
MATKFNELLNNGPAVINAGLKSFHEDLTSQNVESFHLNWKPPAGGDPEIINLLDNILSNKKLVEKTK